MSLQDNLNIHEMPVKKENRPALKQTYVDDWLIYDKRSKTKTLKTKLFDTRYKKEHLDRSTQSWGILWTLMEV